MIKKICAPIYVQIEITKNCNFNCIYCYNFWKKDPTSTKRKNLSKENIKLIMNQILLNKIPSITITGGEPFINKKGVFLTLEMAKEGGLATSINTNFSLVEKEDLLKIKRDSERTSLLVSIPSADEQEYNKIIKAYDSNNYKKVLENIEFALSLGLKVSVNMVLMKKNLKSLQKTAKLSKQLGVNSFCGTKMLPNKFLLNKNLLLSTDEAINSINQLTNISKTLGLPVDILGCYPKCLLVKSDAFDKFKNRFCVAGCTNLTIGTDGDVRPCSHIGKIYGNLFKESIKTIWDKMDEWKMNKFVPSKCLDCSLLDICRGGCRVNNKNNSIYAIDNYADTAYFKENKYENKKMHEKEKTDTGLLNGNFIVNPTIRFRNESFGSLIFGNNERSTIQFLNNKVSTFLLENQNKKAEFSLKNFIENSSAKNTSENEFVVKLFYKLFKKRILIKKKGGVNCE